MKSLLLVVLMVVSVGCSGGGGGTGPGPGPTSTTGGTSTTDGSGGTSGEEPTLSDRITVTTDWISLSGIVDVGGQRLLSGARSIRVTVDGQLADVIATADSRTFKWSITLPAADLYETYRLAYSIDGVEKGVMDCELNP